MKRYYRIAGLSVEMDSFGKTVTQAEPYAISPVENADISIKSNWKRLKEQHPELSEESCEYLSTGTGFYRQLIKFGGFMLHSSAVVKDGRAYLFTARSGTGKSTHTSLWLKEFGEDAFILNDDKPAIRFEEGEFFAYGTPWSGKTDKNVNCRIPLGGICILERGEQNKIERITGKTAIWGIFSQTIRPKNEEYMGMLLTLLEKIIDNVPIWKLQCNMDLEAAHVSYEAMSGVWQKEDQ